VAPGRPLPGDADLVLLPGSKSTIADLAQFRHEGWDIDLAAHLRRGGHVLGLCGGYQMLGQSISDPAGIEGDATCVPGLGLLDVTTVMQPEKRLALSAARHVSTGARLHGYEIHIGETTGPDCARAPFDVAGRREGAMSANGRVTGSYLHGLFSADEFRSWYLEQLGGGSSDLAYTASVEETLDALAHHLETFLDLDRLLDLAKEPLVYSSS
jgi:adenosylcobyric acid synthase